MSDEHNLVPLRHSDISPAIVLQEVAKGITDVEEIFIVTFDASGEPMVFMSGDIQSMVYSAFILQQVASDITRGGDE
jgi:hypothetical protein